MIDLSRQAPLKNAIADCIQADRGLLDALRAEIRPLRDGTRPIQRRSGTSISLVGADGGNNQLRFDPFMVQLVRVVDSSNNEYCLEAVSPSTSIERLDARQFNPDGSPGTALGKMMAFLNIKTLPELSRMIHPVGDGPPASPNWVQAYRELVEWAAGFPQLGAGIPRIGGMGHPVCAVGKGFRHRYGNRLRRPAAQSGVRRR